MKESTVFHTEIERLYQQYGSALVLFAASMVGDRGRAQDAVHQVFLKLLMGTDRQDVIDMKAYLFRSVRNAVLNELKSQQASVPLDNESMWFDPPQRDHVAESHLRHGLLGLPIEQRETVVLHVWGELTFSQIAEISDVSLNTIASRYRYAISRLRESLRVQEDSRVGF